MVTARGGSVRLTIFLLFLISLDFVIDFLRNRLERSERTPHSSTSLKASAWKPVSTSRPLLSSPWQVHLSRIGKPFSTFDWKQLLFASPSCFTCFLLQTNTEIAPNFDDISKGQKVCEETANVKQHRPKLSDKVWRKKTFALLEYFMF